VSPLKPLRPLTPIRATPSTTPNIPPPLPQHAALAAAALAAGVASASRPNILFLITDDQDWHLGSLDVMPATKVRVCQRGGCKLTATKQCTPSQSLIYDAGLTFTRAYVDSPICCPSRTSTFSGRLPHNLGDSSLGWCGNFTQQRENTWTTSLGLNAGYRVGQFGKWYNEEGSFCVKGYVPKWYRPGVDDFYVMCK